MALTTTTLIIHSNHHHTHHNSSTTTGSSLYLYTLWLDLSWNFLILNSDLGRFFEPPSTHVFFNSSSWIPTRWNAVPEPDLVPFHPKGSFLCILVPSRPNRYASSSPERPSNSGWAMNEVPIRDSLLYSPVYWAL